MKLKIGLGITVDQLREKIADQIVKTVEREVSRSKTVSKKIRGIKTSKQSGTKETTVKIQVFPNEGYEYNDKLTSIKGMNFTNIIDNLLVSSQYIFLSMRDPKCCDTCSKMDYDVSKKVWTGEEIERYMQQGGFTYTDVKGKKHVYKWKGKFTKSTLPDFDVTYYMSFDKNLLHPHCRCKWIPLSVYTSGRWKSIPW